MAQKTKRKKEKKVPHRKIGIVLSGGGMRCVYGGGALVALAHAYGLKTPGVLAAESGSVGSSFYYLAHQYKEIELTWTDLITSPKFISRAGTWMNIDYLIDDIFKKQIPLKTKRVDNTKTKYLFPVTDAQKGNRVFVTNSSPYNYFEVMRAAKAIPIIYDKKVRLGGRTYVDGGMVGSLQEITNRAIAAGVDHIIFVMCGSPSTPMLTKLAIKLDATFLPKGVGTALVRHAESSVSVCPTGRMARVICIAPSKKFPVGEVTNDKKKLREGFDLGYHDIVHNRFIQSILGAPKKKHGTRRK